MIPFNKPPYTGNEYKYVIESMKSNKISGDGYFSRKCHLWFEEKIKCRKALLTPSCTHALELAAILIDIKPGDEVIMPSYTFVSTANAFVLRGAKIVFVDIRPDTMNIDETLIEQAITPSTKAIVVVHYAGVGCDMRTVNAIAEKYSLYVIEDAAQAVMASYNKKPLGSLGHLAAFSFHETKNLTSGGEGGLLIINDEKFVRRAEIIREKGTNRSQFFRGMVDKYSWVDVGSSYLLSELQAAYLWGQLEQAEEITSYRLGIWSNYHKSFSQLEELGQLVLPSIPKECRHNAHMFYLKLKDLRNRDAFINHLRQMGVQSVFHYVPLHSSPAGKQFSVFKGEDKHTTAESEKLVRLPMFYGMSSSDIDKVIDATLSFLRD
jgi:dTDP-4-amino-4,6-dideoxygalactose transaminase